MSVARRLQELLDREQVPYSLEEHDVAYTAQEVAATTHVHGREMVKCVVVIADDKHILVAVPASRQIDLVALKKTLGAQLVRLAEEKEFAPDFPDCELGAMPPFGKLYNVPLVAAEPLKHDREVAFNAGSHREIVRMNRQDWERLAKPAWAAFTRPVS